MSNEIMILVCQRMLNIGSKLKERGDMYKQQANDEPNPLLKCTMQERAIILYEIGNSIFESCEE